MRVDPTKIFAVLGNKMRVDPTKIFAVLGNKMRVDPRKIFAVLVGSNENNMLKRERENKRGALITFGGVFFQVVSFQVDLPPESKRLQSADHICKALQKKRWSKRLQSARRRLFEEGDYLREEEFVRKKKTAARGRRQEG
ncbi:hypothetical protein LXL04_019007 [Taraxacum kok-saghyz]